jgi:hypothetical protein
MKYAKLPFLCVALILSNLARAQQKPDLLPSKLRAQHTINIDYTAQWYFNAWGVKGDNSLGMQPISAKNNFGYKWSLTYQRVARSGFLWSIGPQFGAVHHQVRFRYDAGYIDPDVAGLKSVYIDTTHRAKVSYLGLSVMAGYRWRAPFQKYPQWDIDLKGGVSCRSYTTYTSGDAYEMRMTYLKSDTSYQKNTGSHSIGFGYDQPLGSQMSYLVHWYLGLNGNVNLGFLRTINIGLEGSWGVFAPEASAEVYLYSGQPTVKPVSKNSYASKGASIGLKLGIGLWP